MNAEPSRYDQLGPEARALLEDFDEIDLATMLVATQNSPTDAHSARASGPKFGRCCIPGPPERGQYLARTH